MNEQSHLDEAVRELAHTVLGERQSALSAAGLRATVEVSAWSKDDRSNSELRVTFWREDAFVDVVEDFIIKEGKPAASLGDFKRWLEQQVDTIVKENTEG
jgi:hypothetical protein